MLVDHIADARERLMSGILRATEPPLYRPDLDPCWFWLSNSNDDGYGRISFLGAAEYAHRVSYIVFVGPIPVGYEIDHLCFVNCCINPTHLEAVTHTVNIQRRYAAQRRGVPVGTLCDMIDDTRPDDDLTPPYDGTADAGEWMTIPNVAKCLGIHIRTVHRKINAGELPRRNLRGGRVRVWVSLASMQKAQDDEIDALAEAPHDLPEQDLAVLDRHMVLMERVNQMVMEQVAPLLSVIDTRDTMIREQAEEIGRLKSELARHTTAPDATPDTRPWWRRWR